MLKQFLKTAFIKLSLFALIILILLCFPSCHYSKNNSKNFQESPYKYYSEIDNTNFKLNSHLAWPHEKSNLKPDPKGNSIQAKGIAPDIAVQYKLINQEDYNKRMLKEKDLKNHLEAESIHNNQTNIEKESKKKKRKKETVIHMLETQHGPLKLKNLQSDNQVMRALEILISYETFKNIKG